MSKTATADQAYRGGERLYMAIEVSELQWKLAFASQLSDRCAVETIAAGDWERLHGYVEAHRVRLGLSEDAEIVSCYEAGRCGFWIHRVLQSMGIRNLVVDPASVQVRRRRRRAKTDRLDALRLIAHLLRWGLGESKVWSVVRVPSRAQEAARMLHRELEALKTERTRHLVRVRSLLALYGVHLRGRSHLVSRAVSSLPRDGEPLPESVCERLVREGQRLELVEQQIRTLETQRRRAVKARPDLERVRRLMQLKSIGVHTSWVLEMECFGWRAFRNRREIGSCVGLTPTPYNSGDQEREQGIGKAGNARVRTLMVQIAWDWLRYQPDSDLSRWYRRRFGDGSGRLRRVGIVALARKLLIALWRYAENGVIPAGAELKPETR
jgi:transposase